MLAIDDNSLATDIGCARCGYNLRGLDIEGTCPECGTNVAATTELLEITDDLSTWPRLHRSALKVSIAAFAGALGLAVHIPTFGAGIPFIFPVIAFVVAPAGVFAGDTFRQIAESIVTVRMPRSVSLIPGIVFLAAVVVLIVPIDSVNRSRFWVAGLVNCAFCAILGQLVLLERTAVEVRRLLCDDPKPAYTITFTGCCWLTAFGMIGAVAFLDGPVAARRTAVACALTFWTVTLVLLSVRMMLLRRALRRFWPFGSGIRAT